ncbi:MAG: MBL fold metallo-hydrolase [Bacteroidota bacterium]
MKHLFIIPAIFLMVNYAFPQQEEIPSITTTQLCKDIYEITAYGVNLIACAGDDGMLLTDGGYLETADSLAEKLKELGAANTYPDILINTHWHFDHTGANKRFGKNSLIIAHEKTREYLSRDDSLLGGFLPAHPADVLPDFIISDTLQLFYNGNHIYLIPVKCAHTGSDVMVWFSEKKILHIGDIIFADMFPFVDLEHGGKPDCLVEVLKQVISSFPEDTRIIPGHGREYSPEDVKKYINMLETTISIVKTEKEKGKGLQQMINENILKDWESWGVAFSCADWISFIYNSIE